MFIRFRIAHTYQQDDSQRAMRWTCHVCCAVCPVDRWRIKDISILSECKLTIVAQDFCTWLHSRGVARSPDKVHINKFNLKCKTFPVWWQPCSARVMFPRFFPWCNLFSFLCLLFNYSSTCSLASGQLDGFHASVPSQGLNEVGVEREHCVY